LFSACCVAHQEASGPAEHVPVTFIEPSGKTRVVQAECGLSLLEVARIYDIELFGECEGGGNPTTSYGEGPCCRTCHVYVDNDHLKGLPEKDPKEVNETYFIDKANANSRFACELIVNPSFKGMTIVIPSKSTIPGIYGVVTHI